MTTQIALLSVTVCALVGFALSCDPRSLSPENTMEEAAQLLSSASSPRDRSRARRSLYSIYAYDNLTPNNRTLCPETNRPPNRVDSTQEVSRLRAAMRNTTATGGHILSAYYIPYLDAHGSGPADYDKRLEHISGFDGSNGYAWVTANQAALWTDGRYFLQGDQQMDCNWILMKSGEPGYPSATNWMIDRLPSGSKVGADPRLMQINMWDAYETLLSARNITLVEVDRDLIDQIWTTGRAPRPDNAIYEHTIDFAGDEWEDKVKRVRDEGLTGEGVDVMVISALDETAWLFNLRGSDRSTSPLFYSYAIITQTEIRLYLVNHLTKIPAIRAHLKTNSAGTCSGSGYCVNIRSYDSVMSDIAAFAADGQVRNIWITPTSSYALYSAAGAKIFLMNSPIQLMKSVKNSVEQRRYFECQVRDSAALIEFVAVLEKGVKAGQTNWTEVSAATYLTQIRSTYEHYRMDSFNSISGVGENGAVIHYRATPDTDTTITTDEMYLLDSGGNYLDGTTDVTRTFHFGNPSNKEKEAYTRVLLGAIDLADSVWRAGLRGSEIDARARTPLWQNGWDYNHGTGHGIGYFLNVHEGPGRINLGYDPNHSALYPGMFFSDAFGPYGFRPEAGNFYASEPGYYEDGFFGVRLETIVGVVDANPPNNFGGRQYLTFRPATLVPFEPNLINYDLLETRHRRWLNAYHKRCLEETGAYLQARSKQEAYEWLRARTNAVPETPHWDCQTTAGSSTVNTSILTLLSLVLVQFLK